MQILDLVYTTIASVQTSRTRDGARVPGKDTGDEPRFDIVQVDLARREAGKQDALLGAPAECEQRRFGRQRGAQLDLVRVGILQKISAQK